MNIRSNIKNYTYNDSVGKPSSLNLYNFVGNSPVNRIDPFGLSPRDVNLIYTIFYNTVNDMDNSGQRFWYPYWNNFSRSMNSLSGGFLGHHYLGCGEQAGVLRDNLVNNTYDDKWDFVPQDNIFHHWLIAVSHNPNDPVIKMDPWKDDIYNLMTR